MQTNNYDGIADLYDIYVPAEHDIPFFLGEAGAIKGPVLELMVGTGRVSIPLIEGGVELTCEDNSREMLTILENKLKSRGLTSRLVSDDVLTMNLNQKFAGVIIPFNSFAHLVTPADQQTALNRIGQHLVPGGTFICTLGNPETRRKQIDGNLHLFRKYPVPDTGGTLLLWIVENYSTVDRQIVDTSEFFEEYDREGVLTRKRYLAINFRLSERMDFESMALSAGFSVLDFYGDFDRSPFDAQTSPHMIWKLRFDGNRS